MFEVYESLMTVAEAAEALGVGKGRVYELLKANNIKSFRIGKMWRIPRESLELYVRKSSGLLNDNKK